VNLTELSAIAERLSSDPAAPRDEEGRLVVDLRGEVPVKLIGSGVLYVSGLKVIADAWTKGAEEKLRATGSVIAVR
jgi:ribosomal protein L15